ncbi:MAG: PLDc N-terminal domain-containing protein [Ruminococcus sp.]|nr:PLDc N-terminal domain-containing protein [Ruminococcus sp.]
MAEIKEYLPFLIPVLIIEFALLGYSLYHIFTHEHYKRGSRALWVVVCLLLSSSLIGPILYLVLGKEES